MPYAVQLDVDAETDAGLHAIAGRIDRVAGLTTVRSLGDVHHVSPAVYDDVEVDRAAEALAPFAEALGPVAIRLGSIGIFSGARSVLYLAPVVTEGLLALHRRIHETLKDVPGKCWDHYLPGAWVPHVTLAMDVEPAALAAALAVVRDAWEPHDASLTALRLIKFHPVETLYLQPLGNDRARQ